MTTTLTSSGCDRWQAGDPTKHPPLDAEFLSKLLESGFSVFTGPSGLFAGRSESRTVVVIHRGRGVRWEMIFRENDTDMVTTTTNNLPTATESAVAWLRGGALSAETDSLRASEQTCFRHPPKRRLEQRIGSILRLGRCRRRERRILHPTDLAHTFGGKDREIP